MVKRSFRAARPWFGLALIAAVALAIAAGPAGTTSAVAAVPDTPAAAGQPLKAPVFAYYYLWWSRSHWLDMLGPNYPVTAAPLPLPATLNPTGCGPVTRYSGNHLTDVPVRLYSQDDPGFLEADVRQAASAGLSGFIVNWSGTGRASQRAADSVYSRRLQALVGAVHKVNAQGIRFKLWLSYKASARVLPAVHRRRRPELLRRDLRARCRLRPVSVAETDSHLAGKPEVLPRGAAGGQCPVPGFGPGGRGRASLVVPACRVPGRRCLLLVVSEPVDQSAVLRCSCERSPQR